MAEDSDCVKVPQKKRKSVVFFAPILNKRDRAEDNHDDDMSENGASTSACPSPRTSVYFNRGVTDSIWTAKKKGRTIRSGSIYVKSRRFSRYGNLGNFFKPYLTTTKPKKDEIPIDSIGLFNNITFWWVTKYRINEKKLKSLAMERILPTTTKDDEDEKSYLRALQIPAPTAKERTAVNQKRLLAKFGDEEQIEENSERSMYHVLWSFSKTRYLITFFPHVLVLATLLVFPLMLKLTSDSIYNEYVKLNNTKHYETLSNEDFMVTQKLFLNTLGENGRPDTHNRSADGINLMGMYLQTLDYFTEHHRNRTWNPELQNKPELTIKYLQHVYKAQEQQILNAKARYTYVAIMVLLFVVFILGRNLVHFLNLRTAIRFRSGCVGSLYKRAMKSLVTYRISPAQILTMATDESDLLMSLSTKGLASPFTLLKLIIVTIFYSVAIYQINLTLGIGYAYVILFPVIAILVSRVGSFYLKKSRKYRSQKMALMEEFVVNFKTIVMFHYQRTMIERFMESVRKEFNYMRKMLNWSIKFIPEFISILLFSLVALENPDKLNPNANLILLIYIITVQTLMIDLFEGIDSWVKSQTTLDKLKSVYQLKPTNISKSTPSATTVLSIRDGQFNWYRYMNDSWRHNKMDVLVTQKTAQLNIKEFSLLKNQIVGVTGCSGSGKTMLMYSILGHTNCRSGEVQQKGSFAFFPSTGYFNVDTLLESLLMNASYNRDCVDDALSIVGLDELFGDNATLGEEIGNLELSPDQFDKLILAQAIYCENDLILLDNPLSRCDSNDRVETLGIFQNVIVNLVLQKKSIIIATQNQDFLKYCNHIYVLQNGQITFEGAYRELEKDPNFNESLREGKIVQHYNNKVDFCGISPTEMHPEIRGDECEYRSNRSIFLGLLLAIFIGTSSVAYFTLPVIRVIKNLAENDSMLSLFIIVSISGKLLTVVIITLFTGTGRAKAILMDKIKLKKLLGTSMNYFYISSLAETISKFAENNFFDSCHYANLIESIFGILIIITLSSIMCPWLAIIYIVILLQILFVYKFYKKTSRHLHKKIHQSTMLLHKTVTNHIRGRVALQSTPNFDKYLKNCYEIIDANSTAIFMHKAMVLHVQFLVQIFYVIGFVTLCFTILLLDPTKHLKTQSNFIYGIFLFFCFCDHANRIIATAYEIQGDIMRDQNHQKWLFNISQRQRSDQIVNELKVDEAYSVDIQDMVLKMGHKVNLRIGKLTIQAGEIIRIQGHNTQYLVPLLNRILTPKSGVVFFGGTDMFAYSESAYEKLIGFVPFNIQANSKSIRAILDYKQEFPNDFLIDILGEFNLLPSLTNATLTEPISVLAHWEKQLLCVARIVITKPKVIVIENPHPKALPLIEATLKKKFPHTTVLFIGSNEYELCQRTVQLD